MHKIRSIILRSALAALAAGPLSAQVTNEVRVDRIVAVVGESAIAESTLEERLLVLRRQEGFPTDSAEIDRIRRRLLNQLIEDRLLLQVADQDTAVNVSEEDITQAAEERLREFRNQFTSNEEYERELRRSGLNSAEEHRRFITDQLRTQMIREALMAYLNQTGQLRPVPPTEQEMRDFFTTQLEAGALGRRPPTLSFRQIVVRPVPDSSALRAAFMRADTALRKLQDGASFDSIAAQYSEDPGSKDVGGNLGWIRRGTLDRSFEQVAFRLRPGQLSPIVPTQFGFHIIRVDRVDAAEIRVRHVVTIPEVSNENRAAALALADTIVTALRAGASYDSLVELHHDTEEETLLDRVVVEQLPEFYREPLSDAAPGEVVGPVRLETNAGVRYAALILVERMGEGEFTFEEYRDRIREALAQQNGLNRYLDELREGIYIDIRLDDDSASEGSRGRS